MEITRFTEQRCITCKIMLPVGVFLTSYGWPCEGMTILAQKSVRFSPTETPSSVGSYKTYGESHATHSP